MYDPNSSRRAFLRHSTTITALLALGGHRLATAQPKAGSLRILCSGPAGSIPDIVARRYAEQLAGRFAGGAVVDNRVAAAREVAPSPRLRARLPAQTLGCCVALRRPRCWVEASPLPMR
jgi:tripartite-type tricarboxylate transporter receptor subunit TctC